MVAITAFLAVLTLAGGRSVRVAFAATSPPALWAGEASSGASRAASIPVWTEHVPSVPPSPEVPALAGPVSAAHKFFSDVELVDQDGQTHRLYSDLLQGKKVVVAAFFTSCDTSCPVLAQRLAALQDWLGPRLGNDVLLLSFTVDPLHDTPQRLKQYAESVGARPGWLFLTGKKENVDWALYKLGNYVEPAEAHSNLLVVGDEPSGVWKKVFGLGSAEEVLHAAEPILRERASPTAAGTPASWQP